MESFSDVPSLKTIWTTVSGQDYVPVLVGSILIYSLSFILCLSLQRACKLILPQRLYSYAADFCVTMLICSYPYSHGSIRSIYGHTGYVLAAVITVTASLMVFDGVPSPLGIFQRYLKGAESFFGLAMRMGLQLLAAFMSYRIVRFVWSLEITSEHQMSLKSSCESDLRVPAVLGCLLEFSAVLYDTWLCEQRLFKSSLLDSLAKNINGALLVCAGVHMTGMYMHPALATAMSFNCKGTDTVEHIAVYWMATFIGCFAGNELNSVFHLPSSTAADGDDKKKNKEIQDSDNQILRSNGDGVKQRKLAAGNKAINNNNDKHARKSRKDN